MPEIERYMALADSERELPATARLIGPVAPGEQIEITVYLRQNPASGPLPSPDAIGAQLPAQRRYLTREEAAQRFGAAPGDVEKVAEFARQHELQVLKSSLAQRNVVLSGSAANMMRAFKVSLSHYQHPRGRFRSHAGPVSIPKELQGVVTHVFGLDNHPVGRPHFRRGKRSQKLSTLGTQPGSKAAGTPQLPANTYLPTTLAQIYNYPPNYDGTGQCIAVFAFNGTDSPGGYNLAALQNYFGQVLGTATPQIVDVVVQGPGNSPGSDSPNAPGNDATAEVMLDMQMAGGIAPGAKLAMYFTEFTERGWVDAINAALSDTTNKPSVLTISYGNPETKVPGGAFSKAAVTKIDEAFAQAAQVGVTICCASGDDGSSDGVSGDLAYVDFPASSPNVLGCGGTHLEAVNNAITSEVVWNDLAMNPPEGAGGGGVSAVFPLPTWQAGAKVPPSVNPGNATGRGLPDVAGVADPGTGVNIISVDGQTVYVIGGTSATTPMWAGLIARINQALAPKTVGFLNPVLYQNFASGVLRDITQGNNGAYSAGPGWDACTGLGSPNGVNLLNALSGQTPSGTT
ncbi:MAG TPA: S53 family peptidase [Dongiaceae bacterium]|nr:S53 family peptidase [Dongiaceae bacterium]